MCEDAIRLTFPLPDVNIGLENHTKSHISLWLFFALLRANIDEYR